MIELNQADSQLFRRCYSQQTDEYLALKFNISIEDVTVNAERFALRKDKAIFKVKKMPRWTILELDALCDLYPFNSNLEIALQLGRSFKSVASKAHTLKLRKNTERLQEMGRQNVAHRHSEI